MSQVPRRSETVQFVTSYPAQLRIAEQMRENPYSSAVVRVQKERGQTVISTGPYSYVRHPMYTGGILFFLGTSLLLGSWSGVLCALAFTGLFAIRAILEERVLRKELEGYDAYMARVKYRFFPRIW